MLSNNIIVIIGMAQNISIKFLNTCYLDQRKIAGYKSVSMRKILPQEDDVSSNFWNVHIWCIWTYICVYVYASSFQKIKIKEY